MCMRSAAVRTLPLSLGADRLDNNCCCTLAGMKVIGVTTTLTHQEMILQEPDKIFDSISAMTVSDLTKV